MYDDPPTAGPRVSRRNPAFSLQFIDVSGGSRAAPLIVGGFREHLFSPALGRDASFAAKVPLDQAAACALRLGKYSDSRWVFVELVAGWRERDRESWMLIFWAGERGFFMRLYFLRMLGRVYY